MRVALLINFIPPYRLPLYEELVKKLDALQVFISTKMEADRDWQTEWGKLDVIVQKTITFTQKYKHPVGFQNQAFIHIPISTFFDLDKFKPEVMISCEMGVRTLSALIYKWFHPGCKLIEWATLSEHTEKSRGAFRNFLRKIILKNVDAVMVNGASGQRYIESFGVASQKIFKVPCTTDIKPFLNIPLRTYNHTKKILYVGHLTELKGILGFLRSFAKWMQKHPEENVEFMVCGQGPLKDQITNLELPANLKLTLLGSVPYSQIPNIFSQAEIFAFPTLSDEWGVVVNEAMASGLPVLGSLYSQSVEELVEDNRTGWIFSPDDPISVESAISNMMSTPPERLKEFGERGREKILQVDIIHAAGNMMAALRFVHNE